MFYLKAIIKFQFVFRMLNRHAAACSVDSLLIGEVCYNNLAGFLIS